MLPVMLLLMPQWGSVVKDLFLDGQDDRMSECPDLCVLLLLAGHFSQERLGCLLIRLISCFLLRLAQ